MPPVGRGLRTVANGLDHPEGVCWSPAEGAVYAGGEAGQLYRFALGGGEAETVTTVPGGFLLGMALDARGNHALIDPNERLVPSSIGAPPGFRTQNLRIKSLFRAESDRPRLSRP